MKLARTHCGFYPPMPLSATIERYFHLIDELKRKVQDARYENTIEGKIHSRWCHEKDLVGKRILK
ncbi:hypothetical protein ACQKGI_03480 [Peribacillus muralis]|uniref:hypothetical protein n=1 Tax=Peribacillus muralis TaxID=264697 RepID=UPI003830E982